MSIDCLYIKKYVDEKFLLEEEINHEEIANEFLGVLSKLTDEDFIKLLIVSGFIPDFYPHDSSEEVLFAKMIEVLVAEWGRRIGFKTELLKEKSSKEDVKIGLNNKVIVADAKSFRLGRSQKAPNAKDFLKLEDIRKWMREYSNAIGGLVTYPSTHEWEKGSDIYTYCSDNDVPTVMLPYTYLAYLLSHKSRFKPEELLGLWNYDELFPTSLPKNMKGGNKKPYWEVIESTILEITKTTRLELDEFFKEAEKLISVSIRDILSLLEKEIQDIKSKVKKEIKATSDDIIREEYTKYKIETETIEYKRIVNNIKRFRL